MGKQIPHDPVEGHKNEDGSIVLGTDNLRLLGPHTTIRILHGTTGSPATPGETLDIVKVNFWPQRDLFDVHVEGRVTLPDDTVLRGRLAQMMTEFLDTVDEAVDVDQHIEWTVDQLMRAIKTQGATS